MADLTLSFPLEWTVIRGRSELERIVDEHVGGETLTEATQGYKVYVECHVCKETKRFASVGTALDFWDNHAKKHDEPMQASVSVRKLTRGSERVSRSGLSALKNAPKEKR